MLNKSTKRFLNIPPHFAIIGVIVAVVGAAVAALLLSRSERRADAIVVPRAARVERVDGNVGVSRAAQDNAETGWAEAELNTPLSVGDRVYADANSRAAIAFTGRNRARVNPNSSLDVLSLADRRTQLALRSGSAMFDIGDLEAGELFEVATPGGAVDFYEPGLYQIGVGNDGNTMISVLSGLAEVVGLAGSGQLSKGDVLTLVAATAGQALLSKIAPDLAGGMLDDYFGYRYPYTYDGRYSDYDAYLNDPYYYDPYQRSVSYRYLPEDIAGAYDLDYYGDWVDVDNYGRCWSPRVNDGWAPYRNGYWDVDEVWGPTWVSEEPWGWTPYHYGRWAQVSNRWLWVPQEAIAQPVYAPALVAFVPIAQANQIAWVPLAPGEAYVPRYYDAGYNAQYLTSPQEVTRIVSVQQTYVNLAAPSAITAVPVEQFTSYIEPRMISQVNPQLIAQSQPVIDPYSVASVRDAVIAREGKRNKFKADKLVEQQVFNTPVVTSVEPVIPPARTDLAQALKMEAAPEKNKKRKMRIEQGDPAVVAGQQAQQAQQVAPAAPQWGGQDKASRKQQKRLERAQQEQLRGGQAVTAPQPAVQQSEAQLTKQQRKEQRRAERAAQQPVFTQQAQPQAQASERQQRKQQKQQEWLRAQQQAAAQSGLERQQRKAQKRAERQQSVIQPSARPQQQAPQIDYQKQQRKAERRAAQQQQVVIQQQQQAAAQRAAIQQAQQAQYNQQREMRKAQKRAERQQQVVIQQQQPVYQQQRPQVVAPQVDRQQRKMERRAERQAAPQVMQQAPQPQVYRAPVNNGQPRVQQMDKAERKAAKRAGRGNQ
jgi:FecR protein